MGEGEEEGKERADARGAKVSVIYAGHLADFVELIFAVLLDQKFQVLRHTEGHEFKTSGGLHPSLHE